MIEEKYCISIVGRRGEFTRHLPPPADRDSVALVMKAPHQPRDFDLEETAIELARRLKASWPEEIFEVRKYYGRSVMVMDYVVFGNYQVGREILQTI